MFENQVAAEGLLLLKELAQKVPFLLVKLFLWSSSLLVSFVSELDHLFLFLSF